MISWHPVVGYKWGSILIFAFFVVGGYFASSNRQANSSSETRQPTPAGATPVFASTSAEVLEVLDPSKAIDSIGQAEVRVEFVVQASKNRLERRGLVFLDSEADFQSPANLGVAITVPVAKLLAERGIDEPAGYYLGKKLRVRGVIVRFEERPYLPVTDLSQIEMVAEQAGK